MEKEAPEEFQLLDAVGIVREAFNILFHSSRRKIVWAVALILLLPFSFESLGHRFYSGHDSPKISHKQMEETILRGESILRVCRDLLMDVAAYKTPYDAFMSLASSVLSTAAVVYTVASIYTANTKNLKVSYVTVLRADVPGVWKRLTLTFLWFSIISFGFMMLSMLAYCLLFIIFAPTTILVGGEADHKSDLGTSLDLAFPLGAILFTVVFLCLQMYVRAVCYLASVISVLEDKYYGLAAMKKSNQLIKGKRTTALALIILHDIFAGAIEGIFAYAVMDESSQGVGIKATALYWALLYWVLLGVLLCFVNLMVMLTKGVLYFVCKSYHHESIDNIDSLFEVCRDYEPLKASDIDLEHVYG